MFMTPEEMMELHRILMVSIRCNYEKVVNPWPLAVALKKDADNGARMITVEEVESFVCGENTSLAYLFRKVDEVIQGIEGMTPEEMMELHEELSACIHWDYKGVVNPWPLAVALKKDADNGARVITVEEVESFVYDDGGMRECLSQMFPAVDQFIRDFESWKKLGIGYAR